MKKYVLFFGSLFLIWNFSWSNPVDNTPVTRFSELVFDDSNHWIMELLFPFGYAATITDSIIIKVSTGKAKLKVEYQDGIPIAVITSDSLSVPLAINRSADKIEIYTYSNQNSVQMLREDLLIFGNYAGATVGQPVSGYSIIRNTMQVNYNHLTIDCLTKNSSLGAFNDTLGLSGLMKGNIYDMDNNPVTKLKIFPASPCYFEMDTPLTINSDGTYTTKIFRKFATDIKDHLTVRLVDFDGWRNSVAIEPFELNNIHPDTVVIQDIYLKNNDYIITYVEDNIQPQSDELTFISYPNPFNLSTNFFVKMPGQLKGKSGIINIYNASGQIIKTIHLKDGARAKWDGTDINGIIISSGIYYYQLNIDNQMLKSGSMILLK